MRGEQATIFNERLQMAIGLWFLPEGIHFRLAAFLDDESKARCFYFEQFHGVARSTKLRQRTTAKKIKLPLLHSCPGGIRKSSVHSL